MTVNAVTRTVEIAGAIYFSASQVADSMKVSRQTLWRWRRDGKIPVGRMFRDGRILFTREEVETVRLYANRLEPALEDTGRRRAEARSAQPTRVRSPKEADGHA